MGIKDWYNVFGDSVIHFEEKDFKDKRIGIDVSYDIYRACLGVPNIRTMVDSQGAPTALINILLCNISKYRKLGVRGIIYVFDNPRPNPIKSNENKKRSNTRRRTLNKLNNMEGSDVDQKIEKVSFSITRDMILDVKHILSLLMIPWIETPYGYEAEHLGAEMCKDKIIDIFVTSDSDALMFGATALLRKIKKNGRTVYQLFELDEVLVDYDLTMDQFVHLGVIMGCDFADKTKGIGRCTILYKGLKTSLTNDQKKAKEYFLSPCPYIVDMIVKKNIPDESPPTYYTDQLIDWLVDTKNFNRSRVSGLISSIA